MARSSVISLSSLLACTLAMLAGACGGRTDNRAAGGDFVYSGGGTPDETGGSGGSGGRGTGGRIAQGGYGAVAGAYPGYGGYISAGGYGAYPSYGGRPYPATGGYGAYPGYGGRPYPATGGYGAYPGYGGYAGGPVGCFYPSCQYCSDCVSQCTCNGTDYNYCYDSCYGAGGFGGYGGYAGGPGSCSYPACGSCPDCVSQCTCSGADSKYCYATCYGAGGATGCDPTFCPATPAGGLSLSGCCMPGGSCGVSIDVLASVLPVQGGCQPYSQPGYSNSQCPPAPMGPAVPGCCRLDGTCGYDLGILGLGCLHAKNDSGVVFLCAPGAGGAPNGTGGRVSTGGTSSVDACVNNAHSDCERCACKSCGDSLGPCFQDSGCPLILQCANQTGCTGADCYGPDTCQAIIDQYGGLGSPSVNLAIPLFQCARGCGCGFAPP